VSGSFYDPDSKSWTATVDYGDGDGPQQLALSTSKTFDLRHIYTTPGTYELSILVTDTGLATGSATLTIHVQNQIPQANFDDFDFQYTANEVTSLLVTNEAAL
jgi:PKD repeat protein